MFKKHWMDICEVIDQNESEVGSDMFILLKGWTKEGEEWGNASADGPEIEPETSGANSKPMITLQPEMEYPL